MSSVKNTFSFGANVYDSVARIQPLVAARLAARLTGKPARILEIGCGTGALSIHLKNRFPEAELVLTDISPSMLQVCKTKLNGAGAFKVMDGEKPDASLGYFDLITSSLALQWFENLHEGIWHLSKLLEPGGQISFSTLGKKNFPEWRALLEKHDLPSGLHPYPDIATFPWPVNIPGHMEEEFIVENHESGVAFLKALKLIGAGTPRGDYQPLRPAELKRLLLDTARGIKTTYHVLYGSFISR